MAVREIRRHGAAVNVASPIVAIFLDQAQPLPLSGMRRIWPYLVVGLGLVATVAWMIVLSWALYRAVLVLS
jgi:hypothetical protein